MQQQTPFDFVCADTEDDSRELLESGQSGFKKQLTQTAAITASGEHWHASGSRSGELFLDWFSHRPEQYCYFHNLQYDIGNLYGKNRLDALDVTQVGGRMIRAVIYMNGQRKVFLDSFNLWPMSVAKLAPAFGLKKLEFDAHSKEYVFGDIEVIWKAMLFAWNMCEQFGLQKCPGTLGSLCVALWREWGGENCHDSSELSRMALFGGRVELFQTHNQTLAAHTDINSLYPAMMTKSYPDRLSECNDIPQHGIAEVTIAIPKCDIAPLPHRREDGAIMYPYGKLRGAWAIPEINNALKHGCKILKFHRALGSDEMSKPYDYFVRKCYRLRLEAESDAHKLFYKLLMNNLYGRLGTTGVITRSVLQTEKNRYDGVPYGKKVLVSYQLPLAEETNWCHAAYVTAYGRIELQRYLRKVGAEKLIYCDTDSVIFDCPEAKSAESDLAATLKEHYFGTGSSLGEMKVEGCYRTVQVWAPKTYHAGKYWKAKGVPVKHAKKFITQGHASYDMPFRFREAVAFYDAIDSKGNKRVANSKQLSVWRTIQKFMRSEYDKKNLIKNRFSPCKVNAA